MSMNVKKGLAVAVSSFGSAYAAGVAGFKVANSPGAEVGVVFPVCQDTDARGNRVS